MVGGTETWQVYGLGGELLGEYAANAGASSPQKEYGYRNGELLVTASVTSGWGAPPVLNDNPLQVGITTVQARHITELRDAINSLRSHLSVSAYSWQYSATINDYISANPTLEMRTALDQALGAPSGGYAAGLAQGQPIKAIHIQELRERVLGAWVSSGSTDIRWLVTDQLGTPRMIFDQSGSVANVSRHDYLPFGEELFAGTGGRTAVQGYGASDNVRQKFTLKERDNETGLDYFLARYYSSTQGRFTSVDPENAGAKPSNPQSWNGYAYTYNNPVNYQDPDGLSVRVCGTDGQCTDEKTDLSDEEWNKRFYRDPSIKLKDGKIYKDGEFIGTFQNLGIDGAPFSSALIDAGRRPYEKGVLAFAGLSLAGGALASVVIPAGGVTTLGLGTTTTATAAPSVLGSAFSQGTLRAFQRQLAQHGRAALEKSLSSFEKRLAEHVLKIEAARRAGGYTSSMEKEVKIFRESIAAIKQILGK